MIVVAGPSGSGKSALFPVMKLGVAGFNVDDRAAAVYGAYAGIPPEVRKQAQAECEAFVADHIARRVSFAVETTLRSQAALLQADAARRAGFRTILIYVCAGEVEENLQRVARRGLMGGHAAPEAEIRDIFEKSLGHLVSARTLFDEADLFDTSVRWAAPVRVVALRSGELTLTPPVPAWVPGTWSSS